MSSFFGRIVEWVEQKLEDVRQKQQRQDEEEAKLDDEAVASRPPRKRIRRSCRVRDLGIRGLRKKLQVLQIYKFRRVLILVVVLSSFPRTTASGAPVSTVVHIPVSHP